VHVVEASIHRSPGRCFERFTDARLLPTWLPGLKRAKIVRKDAAGLALEVLYEFSETLTYSLIYRYDAGARRVAWIPGAGKKEAVSGWAQFDAPDSDDDENDDDGPECLMRYAIEAPPGSRRGERPVDDMAQEIVKAFVRWVEAGPR
jgi:hypothetical protein